MILLSTKENFSQASGFFNTAFMEAVYESFMQTASVELGRKAVVHLQPLSQQDASTSSVPQSQQYNPFFQRAPLPNPIARNAGVKITPRDIEYTVRPRIGPQPADDKLGIGLLKSNEAMFTFPIEALTDIKSCICISFEGRRYKVESTRPIGFSKRFEVMVMLTEINESDIEADKGTAG